MSVRMRRLGALATVVLAVAPQDAIGIAAAQGDRTMRSSPGLEDVWEMHWPDHAGIELNSAGV